MLRWGGYRAFFYSNERGEPAHMHVRKGSAEAKFWLHDLTLAASVGFAPHELNAILAKLREHQGALREAWNDHFADRD